MIATTAPTAGEATRRQLADLLADTWAPLTSKPFVLREEGASWAGFFPVGSAREFDLGRGRCVIGVHTSTGSVMFGGRRVEIATLRTFPSRPCQSTAQTEAVVT